ncbi:metal ion binding protein [Trypanosoma conorhini]|uniref:Metal ion binding protein n=1 Tax=Trypanosoma conorhini TaxID=83891 RepID=A0A3R7LMH3_9TRYP|nr:metal ion binding protein [Trypanosoma conorhini]RNF27576.1 metal ion binding protein [Trypanosoma conorhini]
MPPSVDGKSKRDRDNRRPPQPQPRGPPMNGLLPPIRNAPPPTPVVKAPDSSAEELLLLKNLLRKQQDRLKERAERSAHSLEKARETNSDHASSGLGESVPTPQSVPEKLPLSVDGARYSSNHFLPSVPLPPSQQRETEAEPQERKPPVENEEEKEIRKLEEDLDRRHSRMNRLQSEMARSWREPQRQKAASLSPPPPLVMQANTERDIIELATLVYNFADLKQKQEGGQGASGALVSPSQLDASYMFDPGRASFMSTALDPELSMNSINLGRMSMRSSSVLRLTEGTLALMDSLANQRDVVLPSPSEIGMVRSGDVLSANNILVVDLQDALRSHKGPTGIVAGAPYFRMVPRLNVAGVAQPNISAIKTIVNGLRRVYDGAVVWVNLREEPLIYINNQAHIVRDRKDPLTPMIIPNVTGRSIAQIEEKLKQEVLQEARENGGNVSVHVQGGNGVMEDQWESADVGNVLTLQDAFNLLRKNVVFFRRPITRNVGPQPPDFDFVFNTCMEYPRAVVAFNCQTGRGKSSSLMMMASIVRFYQVCGHDASLDVRLLRSEAHCFRFRTIKKIISLLPDGKLHERRLMILLELSDKMYSIAEHIYAAFYTGTASAEEAMMHLQQYAYFLVFSYYCEQRLWNFNIKAPFSEWLADNNELRLLIDSIRSMEEEFKEERIVAPVAQGEEAWAAGIVRRRRGNVLSAGRILCSLPMASDSVNHVNALRQLAPDVPIFTCGRLSEAGRLSLMSELAQHFSEQKNILWLSLRAEPMVFINDVSYTLSDYDTISSNTAELASTMHVSLNAMEQMEERLRRDVLLEAQEQKGVILLHHIEDNNARSTLRVKVRSVCTPKLTMANFAEKFGISYHRIPIPYAGQMLASDVDPFLEYLSKSCAEHDVFIINDSEGSTRTTVALNLLTLYRASRVRNLRMITTPEEFKEVLRVGHDGVVLPSAHILDSLAVNPDEVPATPIVLQVASTICQMLTAGSLLRVVEAALTLGGRGTRWNLLHMLNRYKLEMLDSINKTKSTRNAVRSVRTYLLVLLSAIYIDSVGDYSAEEPFSDWVEKRTEVANIIENLEQRPEQSIKYMEARPSVKEGFPNRNGDVLTANFVLKADHFPGCQKKGLRPELCGAPNFRKVDVVNVYGVAIPTLRGINNVLSLLGASAEPLQTYPGESNDNELHIGFAAPRLFAPHFVQEELAKPLRGSVVWVNLREEPILYVGDRPFVLRNIDAPYVNVELTGIAAHKAEEVEIQMRKDVLKEASLQGGMFLVSDEGEPGELVGIWEPATEETVKTVRDVYNELAARGIRVTMLRLPVTDEQSPGVDDFDGLVAALLPSIAAHMDRRETLSFVFNCQMGRGRTTTGMVICCMLIGLVIPEYYDELNNRFNPLYKPEESQLSRGDYGCIVQLKRVLTGGRQAKHQVDLVLEACSQMQNLRTAIENFALQLKSPDVTEEQRGRAHHHGVHYLRRYFNLIVFAAYLQEEYNPLKRVLRSTFSVWLGQRPELTTLCDSASLK